MKDFLSWKSAKKKDILEDVKLDNEEVKEIKESIKKENPKKKEFEKNLVLFFKGGGWCAKLEKSYLPGFYKCKNKKEFDALKPFSSDF